MSDLLLTPEPGLSPMELLWLLVPIQLYEKRLIVEVAETIRETMQQSGCQILTHLSARK